MPGLKRNPKNWHAKQLQRQPSNHAQKGTEGVATMAVKRYMGKRMGNCHQLVKSKHVIEFVRTNPQVNPYLSIRNFSRFLVERHVLMEASAELGLDFKRTREEIEKGRTEKQWARADSNR